MNATATTASINSTTVRSNNVSIPLSLKLGLGLGGLLAPRTTARRAADLFATPFSSSRQRALKAELHGAELSQIEVEGESVTVYTWGDSTRQPIALFSHGWSSFGLRVEPWLRPLREAGYAVVAFDQIGHGRSSGRRATLPGFGRVAAVVARAVGPVDVMIGHSLGGAAVALALADGVSAQRVVLLAPAADGLAATRRFANKLGLSERVLGQMRSEFIRRVGTPFAAIAAQNVAPQLSTPALIVHDLADAEVPWEEGERYARYWPGARLLSVSGPGHHRIVSEPGVIAAGMRFLHGEAVGDTVVSTAELPYGLA